MPAETSYEGLLVAETYLIGPRIGCGGMGDVYAATHVRLPKRFAVKFLDRVHVRNSEAQARFQREAEIASSLGNPHIAQVVDFNALPDGCPYLVMEHLEGEDLGQRLARGPLDVDDVLRLSDHIASALTAAHELGVVHRDIKPDNIFLCAGEAGGPFTVKLLDFGVSKIRGAMKTLTGDTAVLGTPAYMSPEQARGDRTSIDHRCDIYAVGAVLFECLAGTPVYDGESAYAILTKIATSSPPRLGGFGRTVDAVLQKALARDPAARFASIGEMHAALAQAIELHREDPNAGEYESVVVSGGPHEPLALAETEAIPVVEGGRRRRAIAVGLGAVAVLGAGVTLAATRRGAGRSAEPPPAVAAPAERQPDAPAPSAAPGAGTITIAVELRPAGAHLELDGRAVTSPLVLPRSSTPVVLRATASGFQPLRLEVVPDRDRALAIQLERRAVRRGPAAATRSPRGKDDLVGGEEL
jgi:serine/threonine-protein kinase